LLLNKERVIFSSMTNDNQECGLSTCSSKLKLIIEC